MENTLRCPACHQVPEAKVEADFSVTLICEKHGYEARGASLEVARVHWNQFISFCAKAA